MDKKKEIKSLCSYLFVGGSAAIVEWISFTLFSRFLVLHFSIGTILAFFIATYVNCELGKRFTFKDYKRSKEENFFIFLISASGLFINVVFMFMFIDMLGIDPIFSKILSTGIVFFWNYIARRLFVYKKEGQEFL